jgi:parallel beta-helix repeat protein
MTGAQNGWAIRANSATLTATGNKIDDYQKAGIDVRGTGAVGTIKDNTIVGAGRTDVIGQNGIVVSRGASGTVSGNTVSDNFYSPNTNTATGILVFLDPGEVTVENNTLRDNQTNIYVCCLRPDVTVTVSGNSTSGGNEGIHVEAASGVRITDNKTTGAANFGLLATNDASDNTFDGNKASGVTGDGNYDCADQSVGDKTATTANTWTKNTGDTVSPDGICSPPGATPAPTPTPPATTEPPGGGPIDDLEVPPVIVVSDVPVTPPSKPADAANPSVPTTPTGSQKAAQTAQNVVATMHEKQLSACALGLTTTDGQKKLVARGFATAPQSGTGRMIITVRAVPGGKLLLEAHFGGVLALAHAKCITTANGKPTGTVTAFKTALIVLRVEHTVTAPGTFLPDKAVFTPNGKQFLTELRARITAPLLMRCDGYTAVYPPSRVDAHTLSTQRAEVACRLLNQKHLVRPPKIVAHGHTDPIATNSTEAGRRHNRRVEVTVVHRVQPQV